MFLLVMPAAAWWIMMRTVCQPVEWFFPNRLGAVLRLSQPRAAWDRHWQSRPGPAAPAPEEALQRIMEALDEWPRQVKKYGERQARLRLTLYQQAIFRAVGREAWLLFGEWGGAAPGQGQAGLVALVRGDGSVKSRFGPLAGLLLEDYGIERTTYHGVTIFEYKDKRLGRSLTFCQVGGWICTSLRQRGPGPLLPMIDQVLARQQHQAVNTSLSARPSAQTPLRSAVDFWPAPEANRGQGKAQASAVSFYAEPASFWPLLEQFTTQRERKFSKKTRKKMGHWQSALNGIDRLTLVQAGDSLLDLTLTLAGPRPASLNQQLNASRSALIGSPAGAPASPYEPEIVQLDLSQAVASTCFSLAGLGFTDLLKAMKGADLLLPGLSMQLGSALAAPGSGDQGSGRIGLAAWPSPQTLVPAVLYWFDQPPLWQTTALVPAQEWRAAVSGVRPVDPQDVAQWLSPLASLPGAVAEPEQARRRRWQAFEAAFWRSSIVAPLGFGAVDFHALSAEVSAFPAGLLKAKARKKAARWQAVSDALALTFDGVALRLDIDGDRWTLQSRTP